MSLHLDRPAQPSTGKDSLEVKPERTHDFFDDWMPVIDLRTVEHYRLLVGEEAEIDPELPQ